MSHDTNLPYEPMGSHRHLICWKSIVAGLFITAMAFMLLNALGAGILGQAARKAVANESGGNSLMTWSGVWLAVSIAVSLFSGTYFTMRMSRFLTNKVGVAHGCIMASVFFVLMVLGAGSAIGAISSGIGSLAMNLSQGSASIASSPAVQDAINTSLGSSETKADASEVAQGLTTRLLSGDTDSAKNYLAYQTGMTQAEVDAKIGELQAKFEQAMKTAGDRAAAGLADAGWTLLATFAMGLIAAALGGIVGAESNFGRPLAQPEAGLGQFVALEV